ncbi:c-type cytochrome [Paucibacter sp. XJ19-41]|uniref:c-type cytochrome n=1 Tax=Paucibacter sp. XJ19-41 TaxID=2927824 RepID=UPI00234952BC|nr:cytochrome c [Paucibacter sp. XJ19-41]MDC6170256.1 cytochrome c [Paucibacter sp. XJ19-41]
MRSLLFITLLVALPAGAQDIAAGRAKAQACAVCHGPLGISSQPDAPHLAGQSAIYLSSQLKAYRSGARLHEVMAVMAKPLSDADIANLAAWYAAIRIEAHAPN